MTNLWEGRAPEASRPQAEPPAEEEASQLGGQRWGHGGQDARAGSGRGSGEGKSEASQGEPMEPARGEQLRVDIPELATTPVQEQRKVDGCAGPGGLGQPRGEGPCQPGCVKREEPERPGKPQAGEPGGPRTIKQKEGETSWAEYQEN